LEHTPVHEWLVEGEPLGADLLGDKTNRVYAAKEHVTTGHKRLLVFIELKAIM
jgi:hypothetical protein